MLVVMNRVTDSRYPATPFSEGATHYHSTDVVDPGWGFQPLGQIGDHIYYRQP
jgi:spore germination cell wall hydrolase CwlJ-like protein